MGREATCPCQWGAEHGEVKIQLESAELIVHGALRRRVPLASVTGIRTEGDLLRIDIAGEDVRLQLGKAAAEKWKAAMEKSLPTLAMKLGITPATAVRLIGPSDDARLEDLLAQAAERSSKKADLILARVDTPEDLHAALKIAATLTAGGAPFWVIYPKGRGHALSETIVRSTVLETGLVDVKVCAVSDRLTALKFVLRKK